MTRPIVPAESMSQMIWTEIDSRINLSIRDLFSNSRPRGLVLNVPLVNDQAATVGFQASLTVGFNCRIVAYKMFALTPGAITVDIERSTDYNHSYAGTPDPTIAGSPMHYPSMPGDPSMRPSLNGLIIPTTNTTGNSGWSYTDLAFGDMLHFWTTDADTVIRYATLTLYLQDLDEMVKLQQ